MFLLINIVITGWVRYITYPDVYNTDVYDFTSKFVTQFLCKHYRKILTSLLQEVISHEVLVWGRLYTWKLGTYVVIE